MDSVWIQLALVQLLGGRDVNPQHWWYTVCCNGWRSQERVLGAALVDVAMKRAARHGWPLPSELRRGPWEALSQRQRNGVVLAAAMPVDEGSVLQWRQVATHLAVVTGCRDAARLAGNTVMLCGEDRGGWDAAWCQVQNMCLYLGAGLEFDRRN